MDAEVLVRGYGSRLTPPKRAGQTFSVGQRVKLGLKHGQVLSVHPGHNQMLVVWDSEPTQPVGYSMSLATIKGE